MNKRKKDTRWLASVALMMAVVILLANTPLGMIQLPVIKATTVNQQHHGADLVILRLFSVFEHDRNPRGAESGVGIRGLPDYDRFGGRMALDSAQKGEAESGYRAANYWICGSSDQYGICDGEYLQAVYQ